MHVLEKVNRLIDLATHEGTGDAEASTAALAAVRLIRKHDLLRALSGSLDLGAFVESALRREPPMSSVPSRRRWTDAGPIPRARPPGSPKPKPKPRRPPSPPPREDVDVLILEAQSAGICSVCGDTYVKGERLFWVQSQRQICHPDCFGGRTRSG